MPSVPVVDAPSESLSALPGGGYRPAIVSPENKGAGMLLKGMDRAGDVLGQMALRAQAEQNETTVLQSENALREQYAQFEAEQQKRQGHNARNLTQDVSKWWTDQGKTVLDGLENDVQRQALLTRMNGLRTASVSRAAAYELTQTRAARQVDRDVNDAQAVEAARRAAGDGATTDHAISTLRANADAWAADNGMDAAAAKLRADKTISGMHADNLAALANNKPAADAYFARYGNELMGDDRERVKEARERGSRLFEVQQTVDKLSGMGLSEEGGMAWIQKNLGKRPEDSELRQDTEQLWRARAQTEHQRAVERSQAAAAEIETYMAQPGGYLQVPQNLVQALTPAGQRAFRTRVENLRSGKGVTTDPAVYGELENLARTRPADFAKLDLSGYSHVVNIGDLKVLESYKTRGVKPLARQEDRLNAVYAELNLNGVDEMSRAKRNEISGRFSLEARSVQQGQNNRPLTDDQADAVLRRVVARYTREQNRGFFGGVPDMDQSQKNQDVYDDLISRGVAPTGYPALVVHAKARGVPATAANLQILDNQLRNNVANIAPSLNVSLPDAMDMAYALMQQGKPVNAQTLRAVAESTQGN